jgi:hypothetical protein
MRDNDRGVVGLRVPGSTAALVAIRAYVLSRKLLLIARRSVKEACEGEAVPPLLTVVEVS